MPAKIPATVITGFLGAGKTTMIRHMLENAQGKRIALIINEFGDLGVDGDILKGCGDETCTEDDIMELSNGCICCTVAVPQPLVRAFNWPEIRTRVTVDGVVTVVDGKAVEEGRFAHNVAAVDAQRAADENLDHETPLSELFEDQIACADMIVVNKSDLLGDQGVGLSTRLKAEARKGVQVVKASMGALPVDVLLGQGIGAEDDLAARHEVHHHHHDEDHDHHHHDHDEFESFVMEMGEVSDPKAFSEKLADVIRKHDILRLKGFASISGKPLRLTIQAVGPRIDTYFDQPTGDVRTTRLVVIGEAGLDRAAIEAELNG